MPTFDPVKPFLRIEAARKADPVDFGTIGREYQTALQPFVMKVNLDEHREIIKAVQLGTKGERPHVQSQKVSKRLQKVFFLEIMLLMEKKDAMASRIDHAKTAGRIGKYYNVLRPTVKRRSQWIGSENHLDDICIQAINQIQRAQGTAETEKSAQDLKNTLKKVFVLSVYYELKGIEEARGYYPIKCEEKEIEARLFYETVSGFVKAPELNDQINAALHTGYLDMDVAGIRKMLAQAFPDCP
jgi:hypothetical protein